MCARYYIGDDMEDRIREKLGIDVPEGVFRAGDVHPAEPAPVLTQGGDSFAISTAVWGFLTPWNPGKIIINARSETAEEKRMFAPAIRNGRCALPADAFYEWDKEKQKASFRRKDGELLFLGGCLSPSGDGNRFVILTESAGNRLFGVHDRMPLILTAENLGKWLDRSDAWREIFSDARPLLSVHRDYEQQRLPIG